MHTPDDDAPKSDSSRAPCKAKNKKERKDKENLMSDTAGSSDTTTTPPTTVDTSNHDNDIQPGTGSSFRYSYSVKTKDFSFGRKPKRGGWNK